MSDVWLLLQEFSVYTYIVTNSTRVGVTNSIYMIESHGCLACSGSLRYSLHIHTYARTAHVTESRTPYMIESHGFLACCGSLMYFLGVTSFTYIWEGFTTFTYEWDTNSSYEWAQTVHDTVDEYIYIWMNHELHLRWSHELQISRNGWRCSKHMYIYKCMTHELHLWMCHELQVSTYKWVTNCRYRCSQQSMTL